VSKQYQTPWERLPEDTAIPLPDELAPIFQGQRERWAEAITQAEVEAHGPDGPARERARRFLEHIQRLEQRGADSGEDGKR